MKRIAVLAAIAAVLSVTSYVLAAVVSDFVPKGTTLYAMVSAEDGDTTTTTSTDFVDIAGLSTLINIPKHKTAELVINFSGDVNSCDIMYVRAAVDGAAAAPAQTQFLYRLGESLGSESHSFTFFAEGVNSGLHTVTMQWHGLSNCHNQFMGARTMVVTANVHRPPR